MPLSRRQAQLSEMPEYTVNSVRAQPFSYPRDLGRNPSGVGPIRRFRAFLHAKIPSMSSQVIIPPDLPQLAAETTADRPWPLRLLSKKIAEYVGRMSPMWVEGEVLQFTPRGSSRAQFFTLRDLDEQFSINCKAWSNIIPAEFAEGSRVVLRVKPDFWVGNGSLSLQVAEIRFAGVGDVLARLEMLRRRLGEEGLFAPSRKLPLPFLPRRIGLICGSNAKAKDDVIVNAQARWPEVDFEIREVKVQGPASAGQVIAALAELDAMEDVDVIVIARGGGSVEDLLPFSDEGLVRAVVAARTPIVTAIGHEGDRPIVDDAADYRASTPTDAAKRIVPDVQEERRILQEGLKRGRMAIDRRLTQAQSDLDTVLTRPVLAYPLTLVETREEELTRTAARLTELVERGLSDAGSALDALRRHLRSLSPQAVLDRGYAVLRTPDAVVRSADDVEVGTHLEALLAAGRLELTVTAARSGDDREES